MMNIMITVFAMEFAFVGGIVYGYKVLFAKARKKMLPKDYLEFKEKLKKIME